MTRKEVSTGVKSDDILLHGENYKTKTNTNGGLATFEYGLSDKTSVGVILGVENNGSRFKINGVELPDISGKVAYNSNTAE